MIDLTREQEATVERLAGQFDSVLVTPAAPRGVAAIVVTCLDDVDPCDRHEDGVRLDCPSCSAEVRHTYIVDDHGGVRASTS